MHKVLAATLAIVTGVGCVKKPADKSSAANRMDPAAAVDASSKKTGVTTSTYKLPRLMKGPGDRAALGCKRDADCKLTAHRDGACCSAPCRPKLTAYNATFLYRLKSHIKQACGRVTDDCPDERCKALGGVGFTVCQGGLCRSRFVKDGQSAARLPYVGRWSCATDTDCTLSCGWGAVSLHWYRKYKSVLGDCKGGCGADGHRARCEAGTCVARGRRNERLEGCTKRRESGAAAPGGTAAGPAAAPGPVADECGRYKVDVKLPPRSPCQQDADCAWTAHRPGSCNPPRCRGHHRAGTKAWVAAVGKLHARVCAGHKPRWCVKYKCRNATPTRAVCKQNKCALEFP